MEDLSKIKERIAHLLRMAADTSSPNEATIAAGRARHLMDRYQIDAFDISQNFAEALVQEGAGRYFAAMPNHLNYLSTDVARYNDCQSRFGWGTVDFKSHLKSAGPQHGKRIEFWGYENDVALALQMYKYLTDAIDVMCKAYLKDKGYAKYPVRVGGEFKKGMASAICSRLHAMTKERDELSHTGNGTALIVVKQAGVIAAFGEVKHPEAKHKTLETLDEIRARSAGLTEGRKIEIVKILDENGQRKIS